MYAVICYLNYRKDVSFSILKTFFSLIKAEKYALECAKEDAKENGDKVIKGVSDKWVDVGDEVIEGYTTGNGYGVFVYSVIKLDDPEDKDENNE
jgi:hypothetical protein